MLGEIYMNRWRQLIVYNNLKDLVDELNVSEAYRTMLKCIDEDKKAVQIAKELGLSGTRINQMYFQYVKWCRKYTGLHYFEECPPITNEKYDELWQKYKCKLKTCKIKYPSTHYTKSLFTMLEDLIIHDIQEENTI